MMVAGAVAWWSPKRNYRTGGKEPAPVNVCNAGNVRYRGLISYGVNINDLDGRAATYVDEILKAERPPISPWRPTNFN